MNQVIVFPGGSQFDLWPFNVPNTISTPSVCRYYHGVWWLEWLPVTPVSRRGVTANEILSKKYWFIRQHNPLTVLCPVNCQEKCISGCQNVHPVPHHAFRLSDAVRDHTHRTVLILAHRGLLPLWEVWALLWGPNPLPQAGAALICLSEQMQSPHTTKSRPKNSKCLLEGVGRGGGCSVCIQVRLGVNKGHSGFIMGLTRNEPWSFSCHYRQIGDLL